MIRLLVALLVLVCFSDAAGARGPVRNWIASHRPGIVFPKHSAPQFMIPGIATSPVCPAGCASGACANGICPAPAIAPKVVHKK